MKFRTELNPDKSDRQISHSQNVMGIGSCFVETVGKRLKRAKFKTLTNPFGTLFHPIAIENALARILTLTNYTEEEIFKYGELYFSWDHHSSFNQTGLEKTLNKINTELEFANDFIRETEVFLLTFGTAWVYNLKDINLPVANCHKVPSTHFKKVLLTDEQIFNSIRNCFNLILDLNPKAHIIATVSPVRHIKDGLIENNLSKAKLISALHKVCEKHPASDYFPAYEFMIDDLRDYRFYGEDLVHPNEMGEEYIWKKFAEVYFDENTLDKIKTAESISQAMAHRPLNPNTLAHKEFLFNINRKIEVAEQNFPKGSFDNEKMTLKNLIQNDN